MVDSNRILVDGKILDESSLSVNVTENASCKEYRWNDNDKLKKDNISLTLLDWNNESDVKMFDIWLHNYFLMIEKDVTDAEEIKTISYQREAFRDLNIPVWYRKYYNDNVIPYLDLFFDLGKVKIKTTGKMRLPNTFLRMNKIRYYKVYREKRYCSIVPNSELMTFHNIVKDYVTGHGYVIKNATHPHVNSSVTARACLGSYSNRFLQYGQEGSIVFYFHTWKQWLKTNNGRDCYQSMSNIYRRTTRFSFHFNKKRSSGLMYKNVSHILHMDSQLILQDTLCKLYVESIKHKITNLDHTLEYLSLNPSHVLENDARLDAILKEVYKLAVDDYNDNAYDGKYLHFDNLITEIGLRFYAYNSITNKMLEQLKGKEINKEITKALSSKTNYNQMYENDLKYIIRGNTNIKAGVDFNIPDDYIHNHRSSISLLISILQNCYNIHSESKTIAYDEFIDYMQKHFLGYSNDNIVKPIINKSSIVTNYKLMKLLYNLYRLKYTINYENQIRSYSVNYYMFNSKDVISNWYDINLDDYCSNDDWHKHYDEETIPDNIDVHMFEERKYRYMCKKVAEKTKDEKTNDVFKERTQPKSKYVHSKRKYKFRGLLSSIEPEESIKPILNFFNWTIRKLFVEAVKHVEEYNKRSEINYESKIETPEFVIDETNDRQGKLFAPSIPINGVVGSSVVLNKSIREI